MLKDRDQTNELESCLQEEKHMSNAASATRFNGYYLRSSNELSECMRLDNVTATRKLCN